MHIILYYSILYHRSCYENCHHLNIVRPSTTDFNNTDMFHLASADKFSTILSYSLYTKQQRYKIPKFLSSYRYQYDLLTTRKSNSDYFHSGPNDNNASNAVSTTSKIPELMRKCRGTFKIAEMPN